MSAAIARRKARKAEIGLRRADASHAARLHALISANVEEGHLLPRSLDELVVHADRFVIAVRGRTIVGCAELAPLGLHTVEVRSLAVDGSARAGGVGARLVGELQRLGRRQGFDRLCAFTAAPGYFSRLGFSIVPHLWIPEKIFTDCASCSLFRRCGKYAMAVSLEDARDDASTDMPRPDSAPAHPA